MSHWALVAWGPVVGPILLRVWLRKEVMPGFCAGGLLGADMPGAPGPVLITALLSVFTLENWSRASCLCPLLPDASSPSSQLALLACVCWLSVCL